LDCDAEFFVGEFNRLGKGLGDVAAVAAAIDTADVAAAVT
jgi:hypothetical protein